MSHPRRADRPFLAPRPSGRLAKRALLQLDRVVAWTVRTARHLGTRSTLSIYDGTGILFAGLYADQQ